MKGKLKDRKKKSGVKCDVVLADNRWKENIAMERRLQNDFFQILYFKLFDFFASDPSEKELW